MRQRISIDIDYHPGTDAVAKVEQMLGFASEVYGVRSFTVDEHHLPSLRATIKRKWGKWSVNILNTDGGKSVMSGNYPGALSVAAIHTVVRRAIATNTIRLYMADQYGKAPS